ncbi:Retrovirus-related Pol polyprotein from transposon RE1 [Vitis vinifera]|uniref:Retrovirus-related Pol polyprotein from transposon RE1 n=1 Tax=Vitis vinifera TaxID=29760 RepID=A0A438GR16_VITVI|nr:Retrovirus-related Pol polyprotein from transposon RE1 [Vitis vinifera]
MKTLIIVNIFSAIFSDTDHIIRSAKRRSAAFLKAPEPKTHLRAFHAPAREGAWPTFWCRASSSRLVRRRLALLTLRLLASFGLRRQLPSLAETYVCLGKASSSSPVTFLICLGPDIPGSSSTAVIRPPFRALFDPNVIQFQFMGQGYEDHLVTPEDAIPDVDKPLRLTLEEDVVAIGVEDNVLGAPIVISLVTLEIVAISYMDGLLALPTLLSHLILCYLDLAPLRAPHLRVSPLLFPSLGQWILDSGASDHISGNKHLFSSITTTSALPTVTLANGSQTMDKGISLAHPLPSFPLHSDQSTGKMIDIGRESQGLYHLTSPSSPAACISIDAPLLIHSRLGHPSLSKFQKIVPRFSTLSLLACESCQLGKHTRVSFPKRLNNRAKSHFELVHTDVWACYLINRMPSSILHDQIPHSLIFPTQPLYFLPPNVFGCTCFVHTVTLGQDKLSVKATKCIFLGYSRLQKGYCCYSPDTHRYFLFANVTFFEGSPFFSSSDSLPISEVLPLPYISPLQMRSLVIFRFIIVDIVLLLLLSFQLRALVRHFLILGGDRQWLMKWLLDTPMAHEILFLYLLVDRLKACLVAKGYTQIYGCDYGDTFSPDAKIASVRLFLSMAAMCHWPLYQLDIKNAFLHGELLEEVYMEQPPGFVAHGGSSLVCKLRRSLYGLKQSPRAWFGRFSSIVQDFGMLQRQGEPLRDLGRYRRLVGKLNYLTITRLDISFPVSVVSQFLQSPCDNHWDVVIRILRYIKGTLGQGVPPHGIVFLLEVTYYPRRELRFGKDEQIKLVCDNQAALHIASNPVFHGRTKHIEVDCHFIREKIASGCVVTSFVNSNIN